MARKPKGRKPKKRVAKMEAAASTTKAKALTKALTKAPAKAPAKKEAAAGITSRTLMLRMGKAAKEQGAALQCKAAAMCLAERVRALSPEGEDDKALNRFYQEIIGVEPA